MSSGEGAELRHEVRIGKKADIEQQICVLRHSMFEAEAHAGNHDVFVGLLLLKAFCDVRTQFVDIEPGSINDEVGDGSDRTQVASLSRE